jgi:hypothetical protein
LQKTAVLGGNNVKVALAAEFQVGRKVILALPDKRETGVVTSRDTLDANSQLVTGLLDDNRGTFAPEHSNDDESGIVTVWTGKQWLITGRPDSASLLEIQPGAGKECGVKSDRGERRRAKAPEPATKNATPQPLPITVGVFWTPAARLGANNGIENGSQEAIRRQLQSMSFNATFAFAGASAEAGSPFRFNLSTTRVQEVTYTESGDDETDLVRLRNPTDGHLDIIPQIRATNKFDIAVLVVNELDTGGLAAVMPEETTSADWRPWAYAVVERNSGLVNFNFTHEIGHLFGCGHGTDDIGRFMDSADGI